MNQQLQKQAPQGVAQKRDIRDYLQSEAVIKQIKMALPKYMTPDRMVRVTCTAILKTPKLLGCRRESLLQALMICSQAGLEPDGRNAHLIPYGDQVQVIFDYKGLVALAERNGVECIYADRVCENDDFDAWVEEGEKKLRHKVNWRQQRGKAYAYYASCRRNGRLDWEVMTIDEVESIRKRSRASSAGPWVTDFDEMGKKTVLRRMSKRWDINPEVRDAIDREDDTPSDIPKPANVSHVGTPDLPAPPTAIDFTGMPEGSDAKPEPEQPAEPEPQPQPQPEPEPEPAPEPEQAPEPEVLPVIRKPMASEGQLSLKPRAPEPPAKPQEKPARGRVLSASEVEAAEIRESLMAYVALRGFTFDHLRAACKELDKGTDHDSWASMDDVPVEIASEWYSKKSALVKALEMARDLIG